MSATATAPAAPGWLAAPAGDWKTLSTAMTAEVPAIAGRPVPVACAPGAGGCCAGECGPPAWDPSLRSVPSKGSERYASTWPAGRS